MELGDLESYQGQFILITVIFLKIKICFEPIDGYLPDMYVNIILVALRHLMFLVTSTSFFVLAYRISSETVDVFLPNMQRYIIWTILGND